jgi:flagellar basal-body rod protein FlgF
MSKPLWPAMSGAIARDHEVEVIANNLANANTAGFKKDQVTFQEYLAKNETETLTADIPRSPIKDKDLYPLDGRDQSFVVVAGTHINHSQGALKVTDNPLDLAITGSGFFEVATPNGVRYTRGGSFKMNGNNQLLVTSDGYPVLSAGKEGEAATDPASRYIQIGGRGGSISVTDQGDVYSGEELVGKISVVDFENKNPLRKIGGVLMENKDPSRAPASVSKNFSVKQGMLEMGNVNPVEEISNLIRANRMFEQDLKAMKTVSEMMAKEVNDIGKM